MSKRIALICKGFESLEKSDLKYLDNSVNKLSTVLDGYWEVEEPYVLSDTGALKNKIENFSEDFDEFLFYYIGHGVVENGKFYIVGSDNDRINLKDILLLTEKWNKKVTIVLDACHSGQFINEWDNTIKYEIFTSSDTKVAYEDPIYEMAFFTYHFCRAIEKNKYHAELSVENIYDEINDIVITRQKCTYHRVESYGCTSNIVSRCNKIHSIVQGLSEPIVTSEASKIEQIFLVFRQSDNVDVDYNVECYIHFQDKDDYIDFIFTDIYNKIEQERFIEEIIDANLENVPIHFIVPEELLLMNFKQWQYDGNELCNVYHIILHHLNNYESSPNKYRNMITNWDKLYVKLQALPLEATLMEIDDENKFHNKPIVIVEDEKIAKIGAYFKNDICIYSNIKNILSKAKIGLWQHKEGRITKYHTWLTSSVCLNELYIESRQCDYVALLWDDMSLLEKLKKREL